jgi:hypothetical protein
VALLCGCAAAVEVAPAEGAADPACADVMAAVHQGLDELGDRARRVTTSQSTAAWGDPPVVLRCGVTSPAPTTDPCVTVDGVDWVLEETGGTLTYTTYGRQPAVEVVLPTTDPAGTDVVLGELGPAVSALPQFRQCL